jgi:hypothetical protein
MSIRTKFDRISAKMGFVILMSALWFLFWVVSGWKMENFLEGLAVGGVPVVLIWGFWLISIRSDKEVDLTGSAKDSLKDGSAGDREFDRLEYPTTARPTLKFGENLLEIIDISEKGVKLLNDKQLDLGRMIYGEAELLCGKSIHVDGDVAWTTDTEIGLLMALIPSSVIAEERRFLSKKKF